ncbi:hypothetical protein Trydic_g8132 [Trypoxylus dichotomus]
MDSSIKRPEPSALDNVRREEFCRRSFAFCALHSLTLHLRARRCTFVYGREKDNRIGGRRRSVMCVVAQQCIFTKRAHKGVGYQVLERSVRLSGSVITAGIGIA